MFYCTESEYRTKICKLHQPIALLAFGNKRHTLKKLTSTTQADVNEVRKAAEGQGHESTGRMSTPSEKLVDADKTEQPLAIQYEAIHKEDIADKDIQSAVEAVLAQGRLIVDLARKEAARWAE